MRPTHRRYPRQQHPSKFHINEAELIRNRPPDEITVDACLISPEIVGISRQRDIANATILIHATVESLSTGGVLGTVSAQLAGALERSFPSTHKGMTSFL